MQAYISRRKRLLILAISCALHCLLMLLILRINNETITHDPNTSKDIQEDIKSQLDYESQILAQSPYDQGATVIMRDEPEAAPDVQEVTQQLPTQKPTDQQESVTPQVPEPTEKIEEILSDRPAAPEQKAQEKPIHDISTTDLPPAQPTKKKKGKKSNGSSGSQTMTLAQVTQGFLQSMYQERGATPTAVLDALSMARQAYSSKVWHILRQSVNAHKRYITLRNNVNANSVLFITLRADGSLVKAYLQEPVTDHDLMAIEQTIQRAASSTGLYPPIPAQFHADTVTLRYPLNIRGHQGMHSYELNYN